MFSEVLHRALAVFNIAQSLKFEFRLHAQIQQRGIVPLNYDGQVSSFLDYLHKTTRIRVPDAGAIDPDVCTIALADKSMPQSRLLPASSPAEDDPYMNLETGSRSILRTSIAASVGEGIQAAPSASNADAAATGPADNMQRDPPAHDTERKAQIEPVDVGAASSASGSSQTANKDGSSDAAKTRPTISSPSFGPNEKEQLPDSRQVVQGLLRSIPPPKTRPPQSAINRAKRNTVQISALGTIVGADFQASASPPEQHPSLLTRSSSTLGYISKPTSSTLAGASADTTAASQAAAAVNSTNQVLVQSTSTLRPSSETAASEEAGEPDDADDQQESSETVDVNDGDDDSEPLSPTTSSDTASLQRSVSNSARILDDGSTAVTSSIGRSGSQRDAPSHQLLKDDAASRDMALARSGITAISGVLPTSDPSSMAIQTPGEEELPLDDWLLILRGWKEMHDISTSASSFYQSFLKEIQASPTGPNTDGAVQRERYAYIQRQVAELQTTSKDTQAAIDDILNVSQGVGRRLDTLERELDDIARVLVHAS
ncbi:hypothetical protein GQ54DRAFT_257295 [Martensiomyces pterosporus]|nr:hypothetical protein GQ54DRAFT_257295 [Martensiomyces pterosporus]